MNPICSDSKSVLDLLIGIKGASDTETLLRQELAEPESMSSPSSSRISTWIKEEELKTADLEKGISVKLMVSKSKKKVCYAEASVEFVSLLFNFLTVPLAHTVKQIDVFGWGGGIDLFPDGDRLQVVDPLRDLFTDEEYQDELKVPFSDVEEQVVHIGKAEALRLLLSSFVSESALTNFFIK
ncbi:hypothetical protein TIFTF001_001447 [Ficus carica]|uniref:Uncharacterized protein n=1 Tax=Ficus carica TaxID=3494 RepID=A0AA88D4M5_FICCA|nr:hypothetical protein TIFTF001_001447 [Ficus carica]